jgi:hypothetical protein
MRSSSIPSVDAGRRTIRAVGHRAAQRQPSPGTGSTRRADSGKFPSRVAPRPGVDRTRRASATISAAWPRQSRGKGLSGRERARSGRWRLPDQPEIPTEADPRLASSPLTRPGPVVLPPRLRTRSSSARRRASGSVRDVPRDASSLDLAFEMCLVDRQRDFDGPWGATGCPQPVPQATSPSRVPSTEPVAPPAHQLSLGGVVQNWSALIVSLWAREPRAQ